MECNTVIRVKPYRIPSKCTSSFFVATRDSRTLENSRRLELTGRYRELSTVRRTKNYRRLRLHKNDSQTLFVPRPTREIRTVHNFSKRSCTRKGNVSSYSTDRREENADDCAKSVRGERNRRLLSPSARNIEGREQLSFWEKGACR